MAFFIENTVPGAVKIGFQHENMSVLRNNQAMSRFCFSSKAKNHICFFVFTFLPSNEKGLIMKNNYVSKNEKIYLSST